MAAANAEAMDVDSDDVQLGHPTFNGFSYAVVSRCKKRLLEDQWEALESLRVWFNKDEPPIALVCMPTGSGKTGIICCLPYFLGKEGLTKVRGNPPTGNPRHCFNKPVLIIAPNLNIADQLEKRMLIQSKDSNFFLRHGIVGYGEEEMLPSGIKIEGTRKLNDPDSADFLKGYEVIIANAQKFLKRESWEVELPDDLFKLVVVDEAHHFPARTWIRIIRKFQRHALTVFFTATPYRGDKQTVVPPPFAYHLPLQRAVETRIVHRTNFVEETTFALPDLPFPREPTPEELQEYKVFWAILNQVREIQKRKDRDSPLPNNVSHMAFAIAKDQVSANIVEFLWNACWQDAPAITYHSDLKLVDLQDRMKEILDNKVRLVVVVDMLQEGFDHPPVSIATIMTKITSPVKFVQFIGRAQRIARGPGGKESDTIAADIVTHTHFQQQELQQI